MPQKNNDPPQATREQLVEALAALVLQALRCRHVERHAIPDRSDEEHPATSEKAANASATTATEL